MFFVGFGIFVMVVVNVNLGCSLGSMFLVVVIFCVVVLLIVFGMLWINVLGEVECIWLINIVYYLVGILFVIYIGLIIYVFLCIGLGNVIFLVFVG